MRYIYLLLLLILPLFPGNILFAAPEQFSDNVVDITITSQGYDYNAPWQKLSVQKEVIRGTVIKNNRILTTSFKLANHVLIEVSKFGINKKYHAEVLLKDYQSGLAIITVDDKNFFKDLKPAEFNTRGSIKDGKGLIVKWDNNSILKKFSIEYLKSSIEFFDSTGAVLIHQMISDIDAAGQGEPVFVNGKLAGLSSWHTPKTKTIKVIDIDVVERLFKDDNLSFRGQPYFNIEDAALENDANLREYLGIKPENNGVLVTNVPPLTSGADVLKKWDVILSIDGTDVDDKGMYDSKKYGKLNYFGLIYLNHFVDDIVRMQIIRDKRKMDISFKLKPFSNDYFLVPPVTYDSPPKYYIIGGLLFQELSKDYLKTWGKEWNTEADKRLMYFYENKSAYPAEDQKRLIVLSNVLPAPVNVGYHFIKNVILQKVNGRKIRDMNELKEAIDNTKDKYLVFDFLGEQSVVLSSKDAKNSINEIMQKYKIPSPYYLGEKK